MVAPSAGEPALIVSRCTPVRLVAQPYPEGPGLRLDRAHLNVQQAGCGRHQAALDDDGEHDDNDDDAVEALGAGYVGGEQEAAQQDRHGPFEAGEQHEIALVALKPGGDQAQPDQDRADDERERGSEDEAGDPHAGPGDHGEVDGEAEDGKRGDLGEAGER